MNHHAVVIALLLNVTSRSLGSVVCKSASEPSLIDRSSADFRQENEDIILFELPRGQLRTVFILRYRSGRNSDCEPEEAAAEQRVQNSAARIVQQGPCRLCDHMRSKTDAFNYVLIMSMAKSRTRQSLLITSTSLTRICCSWSSLFICNCSTCCCAVE